MKKTRLIAAMAMMMVAAGVMGCNSAVGVKDELEQKSSNVENLEGKTALVIQLPESSAVKSAFARSAYTADDATSYKLALYLDESMLAEKTAAPGDSVSFTLSKKGTYSVGVTAYSGEKVIAEGKNSVVVNSFDNVITLDVSLDPKEKEVELNVNVNWNTSQSDNDLLEKGFVFVEGSTFTGGKKFRVDGVNGAFSNEQEYSLNNYYICDHEVTMGEYASIIGKNPNYFKDAPERLIAEKLPVEQVSWFDAIIYCNKKSIIDGREPCYSVEGITDWEHLDYEKLTKWQKDSWNYVSCDYSKNGYRLPTDAEWEYAAIGGKEGALAANPTDYAGTNNNAELAKCAWYDANSEVEYEENGKVKKGLQRHEVMQKEKNSLGIYDMSGNVAEWCWETLESIDSSYSGMEISMYRIIRGGNYWSSAWQCSVASRGYNAPSQKDKIGIRLVCTAK